MSNPLDRLTINDSRNNRHGCIPLSEMLDRTNTELTVIWIKPNFTAFEVLIDVAGIEACFKACRKSAA